MQQYSDNIVAHKDNNFIDQQNPLTKVYKEKLLLCRRNNNHELGYNITLFIDKDFSLFEPSSFDTRFCASF